VTNRIAPKWIAVMTMLIFEDEVEEAFATPKI